VSLFNKIRQAEKFKKELKQDKARAIPLSPAPSGVFLITRLKLNDKQKESFDLLPYAIELSMSEFVLIKELVGRSMKYATLPKIKNSEESKSVISLNDKLKEIV